MFLSSYENEKNNKKSILATGLTQKPFLFYILFKQEILQNFIYAIIRKHYKLTH